MAGLQKKAAVEQLAEQKERRHSSQRGSRRRCLTERVCVTAGLREQVQN